MLGSIIGKSSELASETVMDFTYLAWAYEGGWPVYSLAVWQCTVDAELAKGRKWVEISKEISVIAGILIV